MQITPTHGPFQITQAERIKAPQVMRDFIRPAPTPPPPPARSMETELGPARSMPGFDNSAEHLRSEIKINGKVVARIYNSGAMEVAGAYADQLHNIKGLGQGEGPDHADAMIKALTEALAQFGASFTYASTAISHELWLAQQQEASGESVDLYV